MARVDEEFPVREERVPGSEEFSLPREEAEFRPPAAGAEHSPPPGTDYENPAPSLEFTPPGSGREESGAPPSKKGGRLRKLLYTAAAAAVSLTLLAGGSGPLSAPVVAVTAPEPTVYTSGSDIALPTPSPTPRPTPSPTPTPTPSPTPVPKLTPDRVSGTYEVAGTGVLTGAERWVYELTGAQTRPYNATVTISSSGENALFVTAAIEGKTLTGEGAYTCDEHSGTTSFVDSLGMSDALVFTEEDGRITLAITMTWSDDETTETITMSGAGS